MKNKSIILKQKKLRLEYRFLTAELEEVDHILKETDKELKKVFKNDLKKVSQQTEIINETQRDKKETKVKTEETKKIYRKIVEATHPDKVGDDSLEEVFKRAVNAHKSGDIFTLYNIADDLGIQIPETSEKKILLMERKNKDLSDKVKEKKKSFGWKWYHTESEEEREKLKKSFYQFHGIKEDK